MYGSPRRDSSGAKRVKGRGVISCYFQMPKSVCYKTTGTGYIRDFEPNMVVKYFREFNELSFGRKGASITLDF